MSACLSLHQVVTEATLRGRLFLWYPTLLSPLSLRSLCVALGLTYSFLPLHPFCPSRMQSFGVFSWRDNMLDAEHCQVLSCFPPLARELSQVWNSGKQCSLCSPSSLSEFRLSQILKFRTNFCPLLRKRKSTGKCFGIITFTKQFRKKQKAR